MKQSSPELSLLDFCAKRFSQLLARSKIVAEVVDERLPLRWINIMVLEDEVFAYMYAKDLDFDGSGAT